MNIEQTDILSEEITEAARFVSWAWPGVADQQELESMIWVKLLENPGYTKSLMNMGVGERKKAIRRIGHQLASQERDDYDAFCGNYYYSTEDVRNILKRDKPMDRKGVCHSEQVDLDEGFEALSKRDKSRLDGWNGRGNKPSEYAKIVFSNFVLKEPIHTNRMQLQRSIDALTLQMNKINIKRERLYFEDQNGPGVSPELKSHVEKKSWNGEVAEDA